MPLAVLGILFPLPGYADRHMKKNTGKDLAQPAPERIENRLSIGKIPPADNFSKIMEQAVIRKSREDIHSHKTGIFDQGPQLRQRETIFKKKVSGFADPMGTGKTRAAFFFYGFQAGETASAYFPLQGQ